MNRLLMIPAGCCLLAFAALVAAFHGVAGREAAAKLLPSDASERRAYASNANGEVLLSTEEGEQLLTTLVGEYLRPWQQWKASPHRLYSRWSRRVRMRVLRMASPKMSTQTARAPSNPVTTRRRMPP